MLFLLTPQTLRPSRPHPFHPRPISSCGLWAWRITSPFLFDRRPQEGQEGATVPPLGERVSGGQPWPSTCTGMVRPFSRGSKQDSGSSSGQPHQRAQPRRLPSAIESKKESPGGSGWPPSLRLSAPAAPHTCSDLHLPLHPPDAGTGMSWSSARGKAQRHTTMTHLFLFFLAW